MYVNDQRSSLCAAFVPNDGIQTKQECKTSGLVREDKKASFSTRLV
jgi:hypothetical protein